MQIKINPELLQKYVKAECSENEVKAAESWYQSFEQDELPLELSSATFQNNLEDQLLNKIKANVGLIPEEQDEVRVRLMFSSRSLYYTLSGVAAALLIFFVLYFPKEKHTLTANTEKVNTVYTLYSNTSQTIAKTILSDGSSVWLSPNSRLKYPKKFTGETREVELFGEAFFEVTKDKRHPFIIQGGGVVTKVLGTSFRIKAFKESPTEVIVITGKVSVTIPEIEKSEVFLLPAQSVTFLKERNELAKGKLLEESSARIWKRATFSFDNTPLKDVIAILNKEYNVSIHTGGDEELGNFSLKADFTDLNLPSILEILSSSLDVNCEIYKDEIVLTKKD
jgi:ferric-dicitrate binding protein FerR (iron transport regulator)